MTRAVPTPPALDPDLEALLAEAGAQLRGAREVTTLPSPVLERPAYRLELADGRVWKGRVFADPPEAARFRALHGLLPPRGFPRLRGARGRAVALDWVAGRHPGGARDELVRCGALLGALHRAALPEDAARRWPGPASSLPRPLELPLKDLVGAGLLDDGEARRLHSLAEDARPSACEQGLLHLDYCADNLVLDAADEPWVVDNATLCIGPLDYDLGRWWYRWPLDPAARGAFLAGYREQRDPGAFQAGFAYWRICALVHSAQLRIARRAGDPKAPARELRGLLEHGERLATAPGAAADALAGLP